MCGVVYLWYESPCPLPCCLSDQSGARNEKTHPPLWRVFVNYKLHSIAVHISNLHSYIQAGISGTLVLQSNPFIRNLST